MIPFLRGGSWPTVMWVMWVPMNFKLLTTTPAFWYNRGSLLRERVNCPSHCFALRPGPFGLVSSIYCNTTDNFVFSFTTLSHIRKGVSSSVKKKRRKKANTRHDDVTPMLTSTLHKYDGKVFVSISTSIELVLIDIKLVCWATQVNYKSKIHASLKAVDTIGNCQRLASTVGVPQDMHKITNLWKFELNRSSNLRDMNERKKHYCHTKMCAFRWLISRPQVLSLRSRNQIRGKLLLSQKLWHFRGCRFSQCFIPSTSPHYALPKKVSC